MRTTQAHGSFALLAATLVALAGAGTAHADGKKGDVNVTGTYQVKYAEVANNCTSTGMALTSGTLDIKPTKSGIVVDIERMPLMNGKAGKTGRVNASSKVGPTSIQGLDGKFSVAGKVDDGVLSLVFIAEYFLGRRALCTQSWNVTGVNVADLDK